MTSLQRAGSTCILNMNKWFFQNSRCTRTPTFIIDTPSYKIQPVVPLTETHKNSDSPQNSLQHTTPVPPPPSQSPAPLRASTPTPYSANATTSRNRPPRLHPQLPPPHYSPPAATYRDRRPGSSGASSRVRSLVLCFWDRRREARSSWRSRRS